MLGGWRCGDAIALRTGLDAGGWGPGYSNNYQLLLKSKIKKYQNPKKLPKPNSKNQLRSELTIEALVSGARREGDIQTIT